MIDQQLTEIFSRYPQVLFGFTSIDYSTFFPEYCSALVFAVPYGGQLTLRNYTEAGFEQGIVEARAVLEEIVAQLEQALTESGINYFIPPVAQSSETELVAPFSFKYAAVNAGLGWIGKNDVVITEKYGPRVRLSAILIDAEFPYGERVEQSRCPEECRLCVDICPHGALTGRQWDIHSQRRELIDYQLCNQKRSLFIKSHGRKNACGLCLAVCPFGQGK